MNPAHYPYLQNESKYLLTNNVSVHDVFRQEGFCFFFFFFYWNIHLFKIEIFSSNMSVYFCITFLNQFNTFLLNKNMNFFEKKKKWLQTFKW